MRYIRTVLITVSTIFLMHLSIAFASSNVVLIGLPTCISVGDGEFHYVISEDVRLETQVQCANEVAYVVCATGAGIDYHYDPYGLDDSVEDSADSCMVLKPSEAGSIEVRLIKYAKNIDGEWKICCQKDASIAVEGWKYELTKDEFSLGRRWYFNIELSAKNGLPVDAESIYITYHNDETPSIMRGQPDPQDSRLCVFYIDEACRKQKGTYSVRGVKFPNAGFYDLIAYNTDGTQMIYAEKAIEVHEESSFLIEDINVEYVLAGTDTEIIFRVVDTEGILVSPDTVEALIDSSIGRGREKKPMRAAPFDSNGDGIEDKYKLIYDGVNATKPLVLRAYNGNDFYEATQIGQKTIKAVAPNIVAKPITHGYKSPVDVQFYDPITQEQIPGTLMTPYTSSNYNDINYGEIIGVYDDKGREVKTTEIDIQNKDYSILVNADFESAKARRRDVAITLTVVFDNPVVYKNALPIGQASVSIEPERLIFAAHNTVNLTLSDANGSPLDKRTVHIGEHTETTDLQGKITYYHYANTSAALPVAVENDLGEFSFDSKLAVGEDCVPPEVAVPEEVDTTTALITVEDNIRVARLQINGEDINILPGKIVKHAVQLSEGKNVFYVRAMDANYNVLDTTVFINYTKPNCDTGRLESVEIQIGVDGGYGAPESRKGTTMVPVKLVEKLGAKLEWNNVAKTATYKLGSTNISVKVDSLGAVVNGKDRALPVAPFVKNGRTFVPLRMIAQELGFRVKWTSNSAPIVITK